VDWFKPSWRGAGCKKIDQALIGRRRVESEKVFSRIQTLDFERLATAEPIKSAYAGGKHDLPLGGKHSCHKK
jgi:hypothetical protein